MDLNTNQKKAAEHVHGPMLVLAGPGSGKTSVVTNRISRLLRLGILPREILALTFTNKAAKEMAFRVQEIENTFVLTTTFHSLGAKILRESIEHLGYRKNFTIYDEDDSQKLLKSCFAQIGVKEDKALLKKSKAQISHAKNRLILPDASDVGSFQENLPSFFSSLYQAYQEKLQNANAVDFDDLLFLPLVLLEKDRHLRALYQERWLFFLIDEYQDTNFVQYRLIKILTEKHQNIFAVGDPDQSIYSWRGALVENILHFQKDFPNAVIVPLEENYRSTNTILEAANAFIAHNKSRYEKKLWSKKGQGKKIGLFIGKTEKQEAHFVVEQIEKVCKEEGLKFTDTAIFYRTNAQSRNLEDALLSHKIPYQIIGGISFYQRKEIKDLIAFLRLLVSSSDIVAFTRTINTPKRGIGTATIQKLLEKSRENKMPILHFLAEKTELNSLQLGQKQKTSIKSYLDCLEQVRLAWQKEPNITALIKNILETFHYEDVLREDPDSQQERKENITALMAKATEWQLEHTHASLHDFLEEISLSPSTNNPETNCIKLMTLHNAKGLEFPLVFIIGLEKDVLPHINTENEEEERRLFYVGITRACKRLFLSAATERYLWGSAKTMLPSPFLQEIPPKFLEDLNIQDKGYKRSSFALKETKDFLFAEGDWIIHQEFGKGIIQKSYHTSYGPTYDIYFKESDIERSLVEKYAKLRPLY